MSFGLRSIRRELDTWQSGSPSVSVEGSRKRSSGLFAEDRPNPRLLGKISIPYAIDLFSSYPINRNEVLHLLAMAAESSAQSIQAGLTTQPLRWLL